MNSTDAQRTLGSKTPKSEPPEIPPHHIGLGASELAPSRLIDSDGTIKKISSPAEMRQLLIDSDECLEPNMFFLFCIYVVHGPNGFGVAREGSTHLCSRGLLLYERFVCKLQTRWMLD